MKWISRFIWKFIIVAYMASWVNMGIAQETAGRFYPYYHQKKTLFELLPDTRGEIIFLGDSITDGGNWTEIFGDLRVKNRGISGDTTDGILARLDEVICSSPAKIFLMIGVNDLAVGISEKVVADQTHLILKKIRQKSPDTLLYLQSVLPVNPDFTHFPSHSDKGTVISALNQRLKKVAEASGAVYLDIHSAFADQKDRLKSDYTNDGLHLTGAGYLLWKSCIEKFVLQ